MTEVRKNVLLSPPHLGELEREFVDEAFRTNWIAPVGPNVDEFEKELASTCGCDHACALSSGTAAIHLGLNLLGVEPGDTVLCSSLTFVASANPILYCGAEPVLIDSEPDSWGMSPQALERAIRDLERRNRKPKACVAVSLYGQAADLPAISRTCREHGIRLMDESAEALGALRGGRMAGTFGDLGIYSFNGNKIITTSGGGALVSADQELVGRARELATQARDPSPINAYEHSRVGFNYRMSNVLAGIGRGQLRVLEDRIDSRRKVFSRYEEALGGTEWMPEPEECRSTRWLSCLLTPDIGTRDRVLRTLQENGVDARPVWKPMHLQQLFSNCDFHRHHPDRDVSRSLFERGVCLPSGSNLSEEDQDHVIGILRRVLG